MDLNSRLAGVCRMVHHMHSCGRPMAEEQST
jgi:hypothetical protein